MLLDIVKIGNSKGVRLPSVVLKECNITSQVNIEVSDGKIIMYPVKQPRAGWGKAFKKMHTAGDDAQIISEGVSEEVEDWEW